MPSMPQQDRDRLQARVEEADRGRRRRSALLNHFIAYFGVMVLLVPLNFATTPDRIWFVWPLVLWMAPLALHTAWAMGLVGGKGR
ncbi:2TM domain-containing protein [Oleisolibacter albus]|uniref:2TM domain-containing protein n=1 Tax=Oleisolibacter albus TaxID=2171757 RepID=UPI0013901E9F|nr:2TM domain-containing protein [Oleisolibacter albus]